MVCSLGAFLVRRPYAVDWTLKILELTNSLRVLFNSACLLHIASCPRISKLVVKTNERKIKIQNKVYNVTLKLYD